MRIPTIYGVSSGQGRAGVAVVRISGPAAGAVVSVLAGHLPPPRRASLLALHDPAEGGIIDHALVLWLPGPRSFTGEDTAELQVHGSRAVLAKLFEALAGLPGLRPAEAGEFTRRAFDHGRLDLAEVEGLADLIAADTEAQRRQALRQMDGGLSRVIEDWTTRLTAALAHLEAVIDFAEEPLPEDLETLLWADLRELRQEMENYVSDARVGERLRDGITVAIVGAPNAGKSSLLNALAKRDAAIVSEQAGTTRDVIEVALDLAGYPVCLADTAGLRDAAAEEIDPVEREGMRRTLARAADADLKLALFDLSRQPVVDRETLALLDDDSLVALNKADLAAPDADVPAVDGRPVLTISVATGEGMDELLAALTKAVAARFERAVASPLLTRARHRQALDDCRVALERAETALETALAAEDLRLALRALGRILGRVDVEDLLDVIFRDFCIGK
jgi:tRNA modification GTPase